MYVNVTIVHVTTTNWRSDRGVLALDVALLWIDQEIILAKSTQICKEDVRSKAYLLYVLLDCVDFWLPGSKFCEPQSVFFKNKEENNLF